MDRVSVKRKKYLISIAFVVVFIFTLIANIPSWILGDIVQNYSGKRLRLYDTEGTFWKGSGLLVAVDAKKQLHASPLLHINWNIKSGLSKFIDIQFAVDEHKIADVYLNKTGVNMDKLDLSLSVTQLSELVDVAKDLGVSGNINLSAAHIHLGKKIDGVFNIKLDNISSTISKVNPLGSYVVQLTPATGKVSVTTPSSQDILMLNGEGDVNSLTLKARVNESHKEKMLQFITAMGIPQPDGSYNLKIF